MSTVLDAEPEPKLEYRLDQYVVILFNKRHNAVFVEHQKERFFFPHVLCDVNDLYTDKMNKHFEHYFEKQFGAQVELVLLSSSGIETSWSLCSWPYEAIFEVISPVDPNAKPQVHPELTEYKWMSVSTVYDLLEDPKSLWIHDVKQFAVFRTLMRLNDENCVEHKIRPWMRPKWYTETTQEATKELEKSGYFVRDGFQQVSVYPGSALLRVQTDKGRVYLKASTRKEGLITSLVASFAPDIVRHPIYVNKEKEWMLMNDYGSTIDDKGVQEFGLIDFENLCIPLGKLHLESQKYLDEFKEAGVPMISPESYIARTKNILEHEWIRRQLAEDEEFGDDGDGMANLEEYFKRICEFLHDLYRNKQSLMSLMHGDIHRGNLFKNDDGGFVFIDWEAAQIDIPIMDIRRIGSLIYPVPDQTRIDRDPYFRLWSKHASPSELQHLWHDMIIKEELRVVLETFESSVSDGVQPPFNSKELERFKWILKYTSLEMENRKG